MSKTLTAPSHFLKMEGVSVLRGESYLVRDLALNVRAGEHLAVLGPNGSGKSTLVNLIMQQIRPLHGGHLSLWDQTDWNLFELRRHLGLVSPSLQGDLAGDGALEVMDAVVSAFFAARGLWRSHNVTEQMREQAREALERASASHLIGRHMDSLSTGEARRVLIARALVHQPRALLLDEACAGLDPGTRRAFLSDLRQIIGPDMTLIMITHHVDEVLPEIGRVVMMKQGRILLDSPKPVALTDENLSNLFDLPTKVGLHNGWYGALYG